MRRPTSPTRDQNLHIHQGSEWVSGTYHDGWHPVKRRHQGWTDIGRDLHIQHLRELKEESADKEQAIMAEFAGKCSRCGVFIPIGDNVWWHPTTRAIRHRGDGVCDVARERSPDTETPKSSKKASKEDFQRFHDEMAKLREQVTTAEQKAMIARKASEAALRTARDAEAKITIARRIEVVRTEADGRKKVKKIKAQHANFERLLKYVQAGVNVALVGDAGSGKTHAPRVLADALGLDFYHIPLGPQTSKSDLLGFISGAGKYVYSLLCRVYEHGGVGLLDEMDAANPATLTIVNGMLEAIEAGFADKMRKRHPDCTFVAAMNTFGRGADVMFVGRTQLDAATLNRWVYLEWNTDWDLTRRLVKSDKWVEYVQSLYESAARQKVRVTIGMRTAILGQKLMKAGVPREEAEHVVIWAPIKPDDKQKILAGIPSKDTADLADLVDPHYGGKKEASS